MTGKELRYSYPAEKIERIKRIALNIEMPKVTYQPDQLKMALGVIQQSREYAGMIRHILEDKE